MIDIKRAKIIFKKFLDKYIDKNTLGFELKIIHTYHVVDNAKAIATNLNLSQENIKLAELIALLHDIGRFEELEFLRRFDSVNFDHALYGVKMLFEDNLIREFIEDDKYDEIIRKAINNHSKFSIENNLNDISLLHCKIIRDADKLDNFRVKKEEKIEAIFPGRIKEQKDMEDSKLSDVVYETVKKENCVNIHDRVTALDYWVCALAFVFDLNFKESYKIIKENNYIDILINRFKYNDSKTNKQMEEIRKIINNYIDRKLDEL